MTDTPRRWLITCCSTGLGRALAEALIAKGEHVIATARDPDSLQSLVAGRANAEALRLDVTKPTEVAAAASALGQRSVDVLVNNAGYGY